MGRGDGKAADQAAVEAMRHAFDHIAIRGTVVIGEGERDEAPMLYIGEKVGSGGPKIDIASIRSRARPSPRRACPTASPCWRWPRTATS